MGDACGAILDARRVGCLGWYDHKKPFTGSELHLWNLVMSVNSLEVHMA